jgi:hypothetical protein
MLSSLQDAAAQGQVGESGIAAAPAAMRGLFIRQCARFAERNARWLGCGSAVSFLSFKMPQRGYPLAVTRMSIRAAFVTAFAVLVLAAAASGCSSSDDTLPPLVAGAAGKGGSSAGGSGGNGSIGGSAGSVATGGEPNNQAGAVTEGGAEAGGAAGAGPGAGAAGA